MKVFVSHTQADHQLVHVLARALHERGLEPIVAAFRPMPGSRLDDKVRLLIEGSDCVVVLNTSGASKSRWVQQEIGCAKAFGKHIVPLKTRGARLAAMLEGYEYYPITRGDAGKGLRRVAALLRRWAQDNGLKVAPETNSAGADKFFQITAVQISEDPAGGPCISWGIGRDQTRAEMRFPGSAVPISQGPTPAARQSARSAGR